jgi:ribosomal protein S18 acetylase RimI-like enzyme
MELDIDIRPAGPDDIPAVRALLLETWHDTYDPLIGAEKVTRITNSWHSSDNLMQQLSLPDTSFLVAEMQGTVVGHIYANAQKPPILTIARLYVLPDRQRRGIGKRLLHEVTTRYPTCNVVRLVVEAENAKGLAFYEREGFHPVGEAVVEGIMHLRMERPGPANG